MCFPLLIPELWGCPTMLSGDVDLCLTRVLTESLLGT